MRLKKWEHKGGFNRWMKGEASTTLKAKCVTDTMMATNLGVEFGSFGPWVGNSGKGKRSMEHLSLFVCKLSKANNISPSSSIGSRDSDIGSRFSSALSLSETNAEASPSSPK